MPFMAAAVVVTATPISSSILWGIFFCGDFFFFDILGKFRGSDTKLSHPPPLADMIVDVRHQIEAPISGT
jgi:hypothetical protein